jgi:hypothetical protein
MSDLPQRWWQWILMYPTIAIVLFGAAPQYYLWVSAAAMGLPIFGNVKDAQAQEMAWERNVGCLSGIDHIKPNAKTNYAIDLVTCPSGDILVTLTPLQTADRPISRWIITTALFSRVAQSYFVSTAAAQDSGTRPTEQNPVRIIGIKKDGAIVIKRVQLPDNSCMDETIDAYTGQHRAEKKAPCTGF